MKQVASAMVLVVVGCGMEPEQKTSTDVAALSLGTPRFTQISPQTNPNRPPQSYRQFIHSVPTWDSAFTYQGTPYPFTMVGTAPQAGGTTVVPNYVVPARFVFADGTVLDGSDSVSSTLASPIFQNAQYTTGTTQWGDAIQRASFWGQMSSTYHVLLQRPVVKPAVTLNVPADKAFVFPFGSSSVAIVDIDWFYTTLVGQLGSSWSVTTFPIVLSHNVLFYIGDPSQCCVIGFHDAFLKGFNTAFNKFDVQTWAWSSYTDPGIFGDVPIVDVNALSHEVSEWMNDPFGFNFVPPWEVPGEPQYGCTPVLETGDPLVGFAYPVTINGKTYHPQNEALVPWFERQVPSTAIGGAYSYPDTSLFTQPAPDCSQ